MVKSSFKKGSPVSPVDQCRRNSPRPRFVNILDPVVGPVILKHNNMLFNLSLPYKGFKFTKIIFLKVKANQDQPERFILVYRIQFQEKGQFLYAGTTPCCPEVDYISS